MAETESKRHALEDELNAKLATAEQQIRDMKTRAMSNVDGIAREASAAIVEHLTGKARRCAGARRRDGQSQDQLRRSTMHLDAEFWVALGFIVFVVFLAYLGVHKKLTESAGRPRPQGGG